jgi:non-specific protein-tyrosine kinase
MDLRKAVEKAKKAHQEAKQPVSHQKTPVPDETKAPAEWVPPVYSESRSLELDSQKLSENRCVCIFPEAPEIDYYRLLRTQIQLLCREKGWNTVMITSVQPGEGKTLTAINLAITFSKELNQTVLLVDCDLRRQTIHKYLGFTGDKGLIDYLMYDIPLKDLIIWPGIAKLTLISGGRTIQDSTELVGSPRMKDLVAEMKNRYEDRYVFFDVPPIMSGADTIAFAPLVDGVLMVVEAERTPLPEVRKALELIPDEKILGLVLNRQKSPMKDYYKYY